MVDNQDNRIVNVLSRRERLAGRVVGGSIELDGEDFTALDGDSLADIRRAN